MGWFEKITEHLTGMFKSVGIRKKPEGHIAFTRELASGKVIPIAAKGIVHPKIKKPRVKKLAYVEPTEAPAKRKIELLAGNAHEVGTKRNIGGDVTKKKKLLSIAKKVKKNVKGGKLLEAGAQVKYKAEGSKYLMTGTVKKVGKQHYHIEGKKLESGKIPMHKIMHDAVIPLPDYNKYRKPDLAAKGKESVTSGKGSTARLTSGTLVERKQIAESRLGIPEEQIIKHPAFLGAAFKIVSDIAKKNGISVELDKNQGGAFWNQAKDADYQDLLFAYGMGAMQSWRRLLAEKETKHNKDVVDENVRQFREVLTGNRKSSYITTSMQMEGKNAAIRHIKTLNDSRNNSVTPEDLEDPEHPGSKHFGGKIGSQPQQLKYTLAVNNERLTDDVKKLVASLQPQDREVLKMKMGMYPHEKPLSANQIAEKLNEGKKKGPWDSDKVNDVIDSVMSKIKANQSAMDDLSFHVDAKLGRDVWKSDEELVADLKKSYPDAIVAVNKLGVCVMLTDDLKKSFSSDLATSHPGGRWITISDPSSPMHGRHLYILPHSDHTATVLVGGGMAMRHKVLTLKQTGKKEEAEAPASNEGEAPKKTEDQPEEEKAPEPEKPKKPGLTEEQTLQVKEAIENLSKEIAGKKGEMFDFVKQQWGVDHDLTPEDKQKIEKQTKDIADPVEKHIAGKLAEKKIVNEKDKAIQDIIKAAKEAIITDDPAAQGGSGSVAAIVKEHTEVLVGAHMSIKAMEKQRKDLRKMIRIGKANEKFFSGKEVLADFSPLSSDDIIRAVSDEKALQAELDAHYKLIKTVKGVGDEAGDMKGEKELVRNVKQGGYETFTGFVGKHTGQSITTKKLYDEMGSSNAAILARHYLITSGHKMPDVSKELEAYLSQEGNHVAKLANERGMHFMKVSKSVRAFGHGSDNIMTAQQAAGTALRYTNKAYEAFGQAEGALNQGAELMYALKGSSKESMTWTAGTKDTLETKRKNLRLKEKEGQISKNEDGTYTLTVKPPQFEKFINEVPTETHGSGLGVEYTPKEIMEGKANTDSFHPSGIKAYLDPDSKGEMEKVVMKQHEQAAAHLIAKQKKVYLNFEAGTGKSKTSLVAKAHLDDLHGKGHKMIVAMPKTLLDGYAEEVKKWSGYNVVKIHGGVDAGRRKRLYDSADPNTVYLISHETLGNDAHHIKGKFDMVVADEAHKNSQRQGRKESRKSQGLFEVGKDAPHFVAMSGSIAVNDLSELYGYLGVMDPEKYGSRSEFMSKFGSAHKGVGYKEQVSDFLNHEVGDRIMTLKKDIDAEFKHKIHRVEMTPTQKKEYRGIQDMFKDQKGRTKDAALARDQRLSLMLNGSDADESHRYETNNKYKQLKSIVDDHLKNKDASEKVGIYCKNKATMREVQRFISDHYPQYSHVVFNGDTDKKQIDNQVNSVRHDKNVKFSLHMRAGCEGLNLQHTKDTGGLTTVVAMASGEDAYAPLDQFFSRGYRTGANRTIHGHTILTNSPHDIGTELLLDEKKAVGNLVRTDRKSVRKSMLYRRAR